MNTKKSYILITLAVLIIANTSMGLFFLPTLPQVGTTFFSHKYNTQSAYPVLLLGSSVAYIFIGALSDAFGTKKVLIIQLALFALSLLVCFFASSMAMFLGGIFLQGLSAFYTLIIKYVKENIKGNTVKILSILFILGTIALPINTTIAGHITHEFNWRWVFALWTGIALICLILTLFLPINHAPPPIKLSLKKHIGNAIFFIKNKLFNESLLLYAAVGGASSIFYTLSPHIFISDFQLSPKTYGAMLFIPTAGILIGNGLAYVLASKIPLQKVITCGKLIGTLGMVFFLTLFYFFTIPYVFMINIAIFMVSVPLISTNANIQVMSINSALAGSGLAFLSVGFNALNSVSGMIASRQDGETMGAIMLAILVVGFTLHSHLVRRPSH